MSGVFGGGGGSNIITTPVIGSLRIQTSAYGGCLPLVYGMNRIPANLLQYDDFTAIAITTSTGGGGGKGGGGGGSQTQTAYTYTAAVIMALTGNEIAGVGSVWAGTAQYSLSSLGLTLNVGSATQNPSAYFTGAHPARALAYRGISNVSTGAYDLGSNASLPNHSFEVQSLTSFSSSIPDALVPVVFSDYLTNPRYGAGFPLASLGSLTQWTNYCAANGIWISPAYTTQAAASDTVTKLAQIGNAALVFSEAVLKVIPYGDSVVTGNGYTFTPNVTPVYSLTDDDFLDNSGADPIMVTRGNPADAFNLVQIKHYDRANAYNEAVTPAPDQANIELFGLRTMPPTDLHEICTVPVASAVANLILQRALYIRNTYKFTLSWRYALLEPMDIVLLTEGSGTGLSAQAVRITVIEEDENGKLSVEAEDYVGGVSSQVQYPTQANGGYSANLNVTPSSINVPVIFDAPGRLTAAGYELWIAAAGTGALWGGGNVWVSTDGASYKMVGTLPGPARYGKLTSGVGAGADPDASTSFLLDMTDSGGSLLGGSAADADLFNTLCWLDGELVSYSAATLTSANHYTLGTYTRRGVFGTTRSSHSTGAKFVRLDNGVFKYPYDASLVGKTLFIKVTSVNVWQGGAEGLADVPAYTHTITGPIGAPADVRGLALAGNVMSWSALAESDIAGYRIKFNYGTDLNWETATYLHTGVLTQSPHTFNSLPTGQLSILMKAVSFFGTESQNANYVVTDIGDALVANVIETQDYKALNWPGTITGGSIVLGNLVANQSGSFYGADNSQKYGQDGDSIYPSTSDGMTWISSPWAPGNYAAQCTMTIVWSGTGNSQSLLYRTTGPLPFYGAATGSFYGMNTSSFYSGPSDWQAWPGKLVVENQEYQFQFSTLPGALLGGVTAFSVSIDVPDMNITLVNTALPSSPSRLASVAGQFNVITSLNFTIKDGTSAVSVKWIDKNTISGPMVCAYNAAGAPVAATIDVSIQGY